MHGGTAESTSKLHDADCQFTLQKYYCSLILRTASPPPLYIDSTISRLAVVIKPCWVQTRHTLKHVGQREQG